MDAEPEKRSEPAADGGPTPDALLHTGAEGDVSAEDLVLASGRELTEENLRWARERLATEGRAAIERELP
ncbi:hypothetical protein E0L36_09830 [Streptomyces sp. AJS327]|uniref:hypothetical protein n=1 Tax=Streptomyces sp. AJS327 TaxID=2545265 RepID=UPI0015DE693B|nr:hypothetical protein [Streptomyces sp. AJS327]MBA0051181.1 hypothetical protein [Streptomyces sp. AJS327]